MGIRWVLILELLWGSCTYRIQICYSLKIFIHGYLDILYSVDGTTTVLRLSAIEDDDSICSTSFNSTQLKPSQLMISHFRSQLLYCEALSQEELRTPTLSSCRRLNATWGSALSTSERMFVLSRQEPVLAAPQGTLAMQASTGAIPARAAADFKRNPCASDPCPSD